VNTVTSHADISFFNTLNVPSKHWVPDVNMSVLTKNERLVHIRYIPVIVRSSSVLVNEFITEDKTALRIGSDALLISDNPDQSILDVPLPEFTMRKLKYSTLRDIELRSDLVNPPYISVNTQGEQGGQKSTTICLLAPMQKPTDCEGADWRSIMSVNDPEWLKKYSWHDCVSQVIAPCLNKMRAQILSRTLTI
jgi:hypothetical protein